MAGATAFMTANIWTGCPLLALWVGSVVVGQRQLSMAAVGVVLARPELLTFAPPTALTCLRNVYDEMIGRPRIERRATWLRSMRAEPEGHISQRVGVATLERIVGAHVYVGLSAL